MTITPPLQGPFDLSNVLEWVKGHGVKLEFIPRYDFYFTM